MFFVLLVACAPSPASYDHAFAEVVCENAVSWFIPIEDADPDDLPLSDCGEPDEEAIATCVDAVLSAENEDDCEEASAFGGAAWWACMARVGEGDEDHFGDFGRVSRNECEGFDAGKAADCLESVAIDTCGDAWTAFEQADYNEVLVYDTDACGSVCD